MRDREGNFLSVDEFDENQNLTASISELRINKPEWYNIAVVCRYNPPPKVHQSKLEFTRNCFSFTHLYVFVTGSDHKRCDCDLTEAYQQKI